MRLLSRMRYQPLLERTEVQRCFHLPCLRRLFCRRFASNWQLLPKTHQHTMTPYGFSHPERLLCSVFSLPWTCRMPQLMSCCDVSTLLTLLCPILLQSLH